MKHTLLLTIGLLLATWLSTCPAEKTIMVDAQGNQVKAAMGDYGEMYRACRCSTPQGDIKFCQCTTPAPDLTRVSEQGQENQMCRRVLVPVASPKPATKAPLLVNR